MKNPVLKPRRKRSAKRGLAPLLPGLVLICALGVGVWAFMGSETFGDVREKSAVKSTEGSLKPKSKVKSSSKKSSPEEERVKALLERLTELFESEQPGVELSVYIKDLNSDAAAVYNSKKMNAASLIKLFIAQTVYKEAQRGSYSLTEDRLKLLELMITKSDNKAANAFIDDFGGTDEARRVAGSNLINMQIASSGFADTQLNRKMHDTAPPEGPTGYENYTSVTDVGLYLERLYRGTLLDNPHNSELFELLKRQTRLNKIPMYIMGKYPDITVANKTGELSQVENDAAVIMGNGFNVVLVIMTDKIPKKPDGETDYDLKESVQKTIAKMGLVTAETYMSEDEISPAS